jgi:hypothetical protein
MSGDRFPKARKEAALGPRGFRRQAFGAWALATLIVATLIALPAPPAAAEMCPPTTLSDLFPEDPPPPEVAGDPEPGVETAPTTTIPEPTCTPYRRKIASPLPFWLPAGSSFGADRDGGARHHAGNDIAAPRLTPITAVATGYVSRINAERTSIRITHTDGWTSSYVHLNNDTYGTDDGLLDTGIFPGLEVGDRVVAGQVIAYVGDSTNAETTIPHLHWELRTPGGVPIDPWASYKAAYGRQEPFDGPFRDDDGHAAEGAINLAASLGAVLTCDELGFDVCADDPIEPERAEWLVEALTGFAVAVPLPEVTSQTRIDVSGDTLPAAPLPEEAAAPPSADAFLEMLGKAEDLRAASERLEAFLAASTTTAPSETTTTTSPEEPTYLQSVGCLWEPPSGEEAITTAEAIVMALVETGWVGRPTCDFADPTG